MKKIVTTVALAAATSAFAADFVSVDVDQVRGLGGASDSTAQYVRAGKRFGDYQYGLQSRTATISGGGSLVSLEATVASNNVSAFGITPFVGVGHDRGFNGAVGGTYSYGLVGATTGIKVGPGYALAGVKTRVGSDEATRTKQTVAFATYSLPLIKNVALNVNFSKSYQDIKEDAVGLGLTFGF